MEWDAALDQPRGLLPTNWNIGPIVTVLTWLFVAFCLLRLGARMRRRQSGYNDTTSGGDGPDSGDSWWFGSGDGHHGSHGHDCGSGDSGGSDSGGGGHD